jgi:TrmH family RNA methyltransferase
LKFDDIKKLHQKKFREESGYFLLEGEHLVQELQKAAARDERLRGSEVYFTRDFDHWVTSL